MTATVVLHCPSPGCGKLAGRIEADGDGWLQLTRRQRGDLDDWPGRAQLVTHEHSDWFIIPRRGGGFGPSVDRETWRCPGCVRHVTVDEAKVVAKLADARPGRPARLVLERARLSDLARKRARLPALVRARLSDLARRYRVLGDI